MRRLILLLLCLTVVDVLAQGKEGAPSDSEITTKVVQFDSVRRGHVRIEETFRREERIMFVMSQSNVTTRALLLHGDIKYTEADEDGDGHFELVMLPGGAPDDFEVFTRERDGTMKPFSSAKYTELKKKAGKATEALQKALKEAERGIEPARRANGSQPIHSETNSTSSAAGSRR